jgi:Type IV Pilus-assembly protein W
MLPPALAGRGAAGREAGFTIAEMTVTLIVVVEIALAVLLLFDASGKLGKAEIQVSDMQQSLRIGQYEVVRMVRMAGRGELPVANSPATALSANLFAGTALALRNNVPTGSGVIAGQAATDPPTYTNPRVVAGTDVITVRGVFSTPLYQINYSDPKAFTYDPAKGTGTVTISSVSPTGVPQPFDSVGAPGSFADALAPPDGKPPRTEMLILVSPVDDTIYGVAQLDPSANSTITGTVPNQIATLSFTTNTIANVALSAGGGVFPANLKNAAYVGILEEYRFYVREVHATPSNLASELNPRLSRARFYPGSDAPWNGDQANLYQDIAAGILDLQVALGFDINADGVITDTNSAGDELLFNSPADNATSAPWSPLATFPQLLYLRVNVLARTNRHDLQYRAPLIVAIEDHVYSANPANPLDPNGSVGLTLRRRWSQTIVAMRNRG